MNRRKLDSSSRVRAGMRVTGADVSMQVRVTRLGAGHLLRRVLTMSHTGEVVYWETAGTDGAPVRPWFRLEDDPGLFNSSRGKG